MIYIDTEFVVELLGAAYEGPPSAKQLMALCGERLGVQSTTLNELLLLADTYSFDPVRLLINVFDVAIANRDMRRIYLVAGELMAHRGMGVEEALRAAFRDRDDIVDGDITELVSSLTRMPLVRNSIIDLEVVGKGLPRISMSEIEVLRERAMKMSLNELTNEHNST